MSRGLAVSGKCLRHSAAFKDAYDYLLVSGLLIGDQGYRGEVRILAQPWLRIGAPVPRGERQAETQLGIYVAI
jgi:hypothetical protein